LTGQRQWWTERAAGWWGSRAGALRWGAVAAEMALLWWTSSRQMLGFGNGWPMAMLHNSAHVVAYGAMAVMAVFARCGAALPRRGDLAFAVAVATAYGGVDELHQRFVPGRTASLADLAADAAGACLAVTLLVFLRTGDRRWLRWSFVSGCLAATAVATATFAP
jgi:VanZ like family